MRIIGQYSGADCLSCLPICNDTIQEDIVKSDCQFRAPTPRPWLMKLMSPITEWLFLCGLPILRDVPLIKKIPGVSGLAKVRYVDFPLEEQHRLKKLTGKNSAVFFLPNHPEFLTDWMIDKYLLTRISPEAACWAAGNIVNGMGRTMQRFWLSNHLIAQLPGHSQQGKDYSVEAAVAGKGVLLHPEGRVSWFTKAISSVYPGAAEMAVNAYAAGSAGVTGFQSWLAPVVWKFRFISDVKSGLLDECRYLERRLQLRASRDACPARRVYDIYCGLAVRDYHQITGRETSVSNRHLVDMRDDIIKTACKKLGKIVSSRCGDRLKIIKSAKQWLASCHPSDGDYGTVRRTLCLYQRWTKLANCAFTDMLISQEQIAGHLKRLRADFCNHNLKDRLANMFPRPVGSRTVHIRAVNPTAVHDLVNGDAMPDPDGIMVTVRHAMQHKLDRLVDELEYTRPARNAVNPFYAPQLCP